MRDWRSIPITVKIFIPERLSLCLKLQSSQPEVSCHRKRTSAAVSHPQEYATGPGLRTSLLAAPITMGCLMTRIGAVLLVDEGVLPSPARAIARQPSSS